MASEYTAKPLNLDAIELMEPDKVFVTHNDFNRWVRFPLVNGLVRFTVLPKKDIQISLTSAPKDQSEMVVISIGYLHNTRSAIGTIEDPYLIEKNTPKILKRTCNEFWIIWLNGEIFVAKAGEKRAFLSMKSKPYSIQYIGFRSVSAKSTWYLNAYDRIITNIGEEEFAYHGIRSGYLEFAFKGPSDAHIALLFMNARRPAPPMVEISLGLTNNTRTLVRVDNNDYNQAYARTPGLLSEDHFTIFCLHWKAGVITVRKDHINGPIVIKSRPKSIDFVPHYFAVRTGNGVLGKWIFGVNNARAILEEIKETEEVKCQEQITSQN